MKTESFKQFFFMFKCGHVLYLTEQLLIERLDLNFMNISLSMH